MDNWAHMLDKCIQCAARACLNICFLYCRVLLCHMCVWPLRVKDSEQSSEDADMIHSMAWWPEAAWLFRSFRLLHVCVKDHQKAFLLLLNMLHLFHAVSERTRIWCPPWTAGIWFWSRPGGRAETTPPSATSTTTMSLSGWHTWARMSSDFSKRSESELGGQGHATRWPFLTHELTQLICSNHHWRHANKYMQKYVYVHEVAFEPGRSKLWQPSRFGWFYYFGKLLLLLWGSRNRITG